MVTYQLEELTDELAAELSAMYEAYYAVTPAHTDLPPYDYDWDVYKGAAASGALVLATAREDGKVVGASYYFLSMHPHHKGLKCALCASHAVDHTMRGKGIGGELLEFVVDKLKQKGVQLVVNTYRTCYDTEPLFVKHGFKEWERSYMLRIN